IPVPRSRTSYEDMGPPYCRDRAMISCRLRFVRRRILEQAELGGRCRSADDPGVVARRSLLPPAGPSRDTVKPRTAIKHLSGHDSELRMIALFTASGGRWPCSWNTGHGSCAQETVPLAESQPPR